MKNEITIKCPYCDAEYLPAEIYIPKYLVGHPTDIERDYTHRIIVYSGTSVNGVETYNCDYCHKTFKVIGHFYFDSVKSEELNINDKYTTAVKNDLFGE